MGKLVSVTTKENRTMHRLDALKSQRISAGLSIKQLAVKTGINELWLNRGEATDTPSGKGNPFPPRDSQRIADVLGVSLATLGKVDVA
jgi:transcriptional regulator with XRE-family HTH domain